MEKTRPFNNPKVRNVACVLTLVLTAILLLLRMPYGLDLTDEPYYSALAYRLLLGDRLFVDAWELHQISALLTVPFLALFRFLTGGLDGVLLFYRGLFILAQFALSLYCFAVLSRRYGRLCGITAAMLTLVYAHFTLDGLSYCNMGPMLVILSGLHWIRAESAKHPAPFRLMSGIAYALSVGVYPSFVLSLPFVILYLILFARKNRPAVTCFTLGLLSVIAVFAVLLLLRSTPAEVIAGIRGMLSDPDHQSENPLLSVLRFPNYVRVLFSYAAYLAAALLLLLPVRPLLSARVGQRLDALLPYLFLLTLCLAAVRVFTVSYEPYLCCNLAAMIPALLFPSAFLASEKKDDPAGFLLLLGALLVIGVQVGSNTRFHASSGAALPLSVASLAFLAPFFDRVRVRRLGRVLAVVSCVLCVVSVGYWRFNAVYRDAPLARLDTVVSSGPAMGCITTKERAEAVETLCREVRENGADEGSMLVVRLMPIAYLSATQTFSTPSVFNMRPNSAWLADYLAAHPDRVPTRIFWIDTAIDETNSEPTAETLSFAAEYRRIPCEALTVYAR